MPHPYGMLGLVVDVLGGAGAITVERYAPAVIDPATGYATRGATTVIPTDAVVNPLDPASLDELDLEANDEAIELFTKSALVVSESGVESESDRVLWQGRTYRVILVENRTVQAEINRAVALRVRE